MGDKSVIDKVTQRLLKEGLLKCWRIHPASRSYPVYYVPEMLGFSEEGLRSLKTTSVALHSFDCLPWPEPNCILCGPGLIPPACPVRMLSLWVHSSSVPSFQGRPVHLARNMRFAEHVVSVSVALSLRTNLLHCEGGTIGIAKATRPLPSFTAPDYERLLSSEWRSIVTAAPDFMAEADIRSLGLAAEAANSTTDSMPWCAWMDDEPDMSPAVVAEVFCNLASILTPCHYMVNVRFPKGFGSPSQRRLTCEKPIFAIIPFSRLHRHAEGNGDDREVTPHFRRGHIRHHWQRAGLNRLALPDSPHERLRLVHDHKVDRSYIPPMWVGNREFQDSGLTFTVVADEMRLPKLWN